MSCLYADMILDLRKNSMNEVEKRFIDEKLKTGKKPFLSKSARFNKCRVKNNSHVTKEVTQISLDSQN